MSKPSPQLANPWGGGGLKGNIAHSAPALKRVFLSLVFVPTVRRPVFTLWPLPCERAPSLKGWGSLPRASRNPIADPNPPIVRPAGWRFFLSSPALCGRAHFKCSKCWLISRLLAYPSCI